MHAIRKLRESGHATVLTTKQFSLQMLFFTALSRVVQSLQKIFATSTTLREGAYTGEWKLDDRRTLLRWKGKFRVTSWKASILSKKTTRDSSSIAQ